MFQWIIRFYENASVIKFQIKQKARKQHNVLSPSFKLW